MPSWRVRRLGVYRLRALARALTPILASPCAGPAPRGMRDRPPGYYERVPGVRIIKSRIQGIISETAALSVTSMALVLEK